MRSVPVSYNRFFPHDLSHRVCREFDPSWVAVAKAWSKVPPSERDSHFFATIDFDDGQMIFQRVGFFVCLSAT